MKFITGEPGNSHMVFDKFGEPAFIRLSLRLSEEQYRAVIDRGQLEVTIAPIQTREERLREARLEALNAEMNIALRYPMEILAIIERVDAAFAKENPE